MATKSFDLNEFIRRIQKDTDLVDPRLLSEKILAELTDEEKILVCQQTLPNYIRLVANADARSGSGDRVQKYQSSAKGDAIRSWSQRLLSGGVDVSGGSGQWKKLADCTRAELLTVAAHRDKLADANHRAAERYRKLAAAMLKAKVEKVSDLPIGKLTAIFDPQGVAA